MKTVGVDPGSANAAIATWDGETLDVDDFPTVKSKGRGFEINVVAAVDMIQFRFAGFDHAFIEQVQARPGEGAGTGFKFGYGCGIIRGLIVAQMAPTTMVPSSVWKPPMGLNSDKDYSRAQAIALFPKYAHLFARKKDNNRAEAALIALYGFKKLHGTIK